MKVNLQPNQALYKMSESKRKQLFSYLLNEFQSSSSQTMEAHPYESGKGTKKKSMSLEKKT